MVTVGFPVPSIGEDGVLPAGVAFVGNGDGTATLSGTPASGSAGTYPITLTAHNDLDPDAVQAFSLRVEGAVGDANNDGQVNVQDVFYLINDLFAGGPPPIGPGDVNGSGAVDVADVFYLINYLFAGGPAPV